MFEIFICNMVFIPDNLHTVTKLHMHNGTCRHVRIVFTRTVHSAINCRERHTVTVVYQILLLIAEPVNRPGGASFATTIVDAEPRGSWRNADYERKRGSATNVVNTASCTPLTPY